MKRARRAEKKLHITGTRTRVHYIDKTHVNLRYLKFTIFYEIEDYCKNYFYWMVLTFFFIYLFIHYLINDFLLTCLNTFLLRLCT